MCDGASAAMAFSAAMAGYGIDQQNKQQKRQQAMIDHEQQLNDEKARQIIGDVHQDAQQYGADQRQQNYTNAREQAVQSLTEHLTKARDGDNHGQGYSGNVSSTYLTEKAKRAAKTKERAYRMASLLGRMRAPQSVHRTEALNSSSIQMGHGSTGGVKSAFGQEIG